MDIKSQLINDVPTITFLDLWYAAKERSRITFGYSAVIEDGLIPDSDWLMQNMALVARGVFQSGEMPGKGKFIGQLVQRFDPYGVSVSFDNQTQTIKVGVFLWEEVYGSTDGNSQADGTVGHAHAADGSTVADNP